MIDWEQVNHAAKVLLDGHDVARKKPMAEREPIEMHIAQMGRNRLKSIVAISERAMINQKSK